MAIEVRVSRGYMWRTLVIAAVSLVFGLWGVWDYVVAIPRDQMNADRLELLQLCKDAMETEQARGQLTPEAMQAYEAVRAELAGVLRTELAEAGDLTAISDPKEFGQVMADFREELEQSSNVQWVALLTTLGNGLVAERRLPLIEENYPVAHAAFAQAQVAIEELGEVTAPGKYDRITQWAFMLCLPCVPWFLWLYFAARRRVYRLDDDGTLHMPEGAWTKDDITDIDMGRWMAKSIAWVVNRNGKRVPLDDYKYRDLYLIVGSIASRLHPDEWDGEAKPVDRDSDTDADGTADAPAGSETADSPSGRRVQDAAATASTDAG